MSFPKQIIAEMAKMLRSKFILISGIIIFCIITIAMPLLVHFAGNNGGIVGGMLGTNVYYDTSYYGYGYGDGDYQTFEYNGVEIVLNNQFAWEMQWKVDQLSYLDDQLSGDSLRYAQDVLDAEIEYYFQYAQLEIAEDDYRLRYSYEMGQKVGEMYVMGLEDPDLEALKLGYEYVSWGVDFEAYAEMTAAEKLERYDILEQDLADYNKLMLENDFSVYIDIAKRGYEQDLIEYESRIESLEEMAASDPNQEDYVTQEIEYLEGELENIVNIYIPELDYRLANGIIPDGSTWQDLALDESSSSRRRIDNFDRYLMTEEEFYEDQWQVEQYVTYEKYVASQEIEKQEAEYDLLIAQNSLNNEAPDMRFVPTGARQQLYNTFNTQFLIVIFGILVGGWAMATEFQSGTVRLLMIRPRTRIKVLASRFLAGLLLVYILYLAILIVTMITQGFIGGFSDYLYPNYTASGEVNFFLMLIGNLLAISTVFLFFYAFSFACSSVIKNIAVAIIIPIIILLGATILTAFLTSVPSVDIIAFTPLPYVSMQEFFDDGYTITSELISRGMPISLGLGVGVMLAYGAIFTAIATYIFKKIDITN